MIIDVVQDTEFLIEEWPRRLEVQGWVVWYESHRQKAPEKYTNLDLEMAGMTKKAEEQLYEHQQKPQEEIFSARIQTRKEKPARLQFDNESQNSNNIGSEQTQVPGLDRLQTAINEVSQAISNVTAL